MNNLPRRLTPLEIIERAEARARRDRWIAFCIFCGTIFGIVAVVLAVWRG